MQERSVEGVLRVSAKSESSFVDFGRRESGTRMTMFGAEIKAAVQGMRRNGSLESEGAIVLWLWFLSCFFFGSAGYFFVAQGFGFFSVEYAIWDVFVPGLAVKGNGLVSRYLSGKEVAGEVLLK